jgi:pyruvate,water dikinase
MDGPSLMEKESYVVRLRELGSADASRVGGKNASLGELIRALRPAGVNVPAGFATTAQAYREQPRAA